MQDEPGMTNIVWATRNQSSHNKSILFCKQSASLNYNTISSQIRLPQNKDLSPASVRTQSALYSVTDYAHIWLAWPVISREVEIYVNIIKVPSLQKSKLPAEA